MWKSFESALALYHNECIKEWIFRGYKNTMPLLDIKYVVYPFWLGNEKFHASHRSNLLRKDFKFYSQYGWQEENNLPYIWPTKEDKMLHGIKTKGEAQQYGIDYQNWVSKQNLSYGELVDYQIKLHAIAKKFGLVREFKENGIL